MQSPGLNRQCLEGASTYPYLNTDHLLIVGGVD